MSSIDVVRGVERRGRGSLVPRSAEFIIETIGCSYRQLDRWASQGLFGDDMANVGPGARRQWTNVHAEIALALTALSRLGAQYPAWKLASESIAVRPIAADGEVLVVALDGRSQRHAHWCATPDVLGDAAYVISLRSFATVTPATSGDDSPADIARPGEPGVTAPAAVTPTPSSP